MNFDSFSQMQSQCRIDANDRIDAYLPILHDPFRLCPTEVQLLSDQRRERLSHVFLADYPGSEQHKHSPRITTALHPNAEGRDAA